MSEIIEETANDTEYDETLGTRYRHPTNADKIRHMTDEELADWISEQGVDCAYCRIESLCYEECKFGDCKKAWLIWLKQEVSDA